MTSADLVPVLVKMAFGALLVVAASVIAERTSPFVAAVVASFPISAGPAYVFLALDHSAEFVAASALASIAVNVATIGFVALFVLAVDRLRLVTCLTLDLILWFAAAVVVARLPWTTTTAIAANGVALMLAATVTAGKRRGRGRAPSGGRWRDLVLRGGVVMVVIAATTLGSRLLGATFAGMAAVFPIALASLATVLTVRIGPEGGAAVMANTLLGMVGFVGGLGVVNLTAVTLGSAAALSAGLAVCVAWNLVLFALRDVGPRPETPA